MGGRAGLEPHYWGSVFRGAVGGTRLAACLFGLPCGAPWLTLLLPLATPPALCTPLSPCQLLLPERVRAGLLRVPSGHCRCAWTYIEQRSVEGAHCHWRLPVVVQGCVGGLPPALRCPLAHCAHTYTETHPHTRNTASTLTLSAPQFPALAASVVFMGEMMSPNRRLLAVFPVGLFYMVVSWMVFMV